MDSERKTGNIFIILAILIFSGCIPAKPTLEPTKAPTTLPLTTPEPTSEPIKAPTVYSSPTPEPPPIPSPIPDSAMAWHGEWMVWFGPDEIETIMFFEQDGKDLTTLIYDISATISEDGRTITGEISERGYTGIVKAALQENGTQFTGNVSGLFPICGARLGKPKPDPCMWP